jgi:hypothetical protein
MRRLFRILALPFVVFLGGAIYHGPALLHGYDDGRAELTFDEVVAGKRPAGTRNLTISGGRAYLESNVTSDLRKQDDSGRSLSTGKTSMYVPLVAKDWDGTGKVAVLLKADYGYMLSALKQMDRFEGTLRNALWEDIEKKDEVLGLLAKGGVNVVDDHWCSTSPDICAVICGWPGW